MIYEVVSKNRGTITSTEDLKIALQRYQDWFDKKDETSDNNEHKQIKLQKTKFEEAQKLIENYNLETAILETPAFKEWKNKNN